MGGDNFPTNKIWHSDGVALIPSGAINMILNTPGYVLVICQSYQY